MSIRSRRSVGTLRPFAQWFLFAVVCGWPLQAQTNEYMDKDNVEGTYVQLAAFPIRPVVHLPQFGELWAVNQHASEVQRFDANATGNDVSPSLTVPVAWGPVSVAYWEGSGGSCGDEILVVCRGSWAVVRIDRASGDLVGVIQLRPSDSLPNNISVTARMGVMAEPGDIVVDDDTDMAFVSCTASDSVLQIDLCTESPGEDPIVRVFNEKDDVDFRCKSPLFLSLEDDGTVLVTPLTSGNNTIWMNEPGGGSLNAGTSVVDLTDTSIAAEPLPDDDLFRITPLVEDASGTVTDKGTVKVAAKALGTLLFSHDRNDAGDLWVLNTDAVNAEEQGEPNITGRFVRSRITTLSASGGPPTFIDLDPVSAGGAQPDDRAVGQPFALAFNDFDQAFVTGLLTDNVAVVDSGGVVAEWKLDEADSRLRALPRGILVKETTTVSTGTVIVYCWGDNKLREYDYDLGVPSDPATFVRSYDLGADPAPQDIREGRGLFFNGNLSELGNISCASCHVDTGADQVVWNLGNLLKENDAGTETISIDDKGGMVTQTMVGLERLAPFHWRGERQLAHFNEFGVPGLLGGEEMNDDAFGKFEAFVFSLANPANPNQNRARVIDDGIKVAHDLGPGFVQKPRRGQQIFRDNEMFKDNGAPSEPANFRCSTCHPQPTGTNNDFHDEVFGITRPRRAMLKPTAFHELWRKQQTPFEIELVASPVNVFDEVAFLGQGFTHTGEFKDMFEFVHSITASDDRDQDALDMTSFLNQWDQGLAPSVHYSYLLDASSPQPEASIELAGFLVREAIERDCGIAVLGEVLDSQQQLKSRRWFFDRHKGANGLFVCEDSNFNDRTITQFTDAAQQETNLFIGMPVGMAERFAVDYDMDGCVNFDDNEPNNPDVSCVQNPPVPTFTEGPTKRWETSKVARIYFDTDQPTTAVVRYRRNLTGTPWRTVESSEFSRTHAVILNDLHPQTVTTASWMEPQPMAVPMDYLVEVEVTNRGGLTSPTASLSFQTDPFLAPPVGFFPESNLKERQRLTRSMISDLDFEVTRNGDTISGVVDVSVNFQRGGDYDTTGEFQRPPAQDRIVIGRVFATQTAASTADRHFGITPNPLPGTLLAGEVSLDVPPDKTLEVTGATGGYDAPFLINAVRTNGIDGVARIEFDFSAQAFHLARQDELLFVVDAVIEIVDEAEWSTTVTNHVNGNPLVLPVNHTNPSYPENNIFALTQWSFPDTGEAQAARTEVIP